MKKPRVFGWDPVKLCDNLSMEQLVELQREVSDQHANPRGEDGIYRENGSTTIHLIDAAGRKKLDKIGWAIAFKIADKRENRA